MRSTTTDPERPRQRLRRSHRRALCWDAGQPLTISAGAAASRSPRRRLAYASQPLHGELRGPGRDPRRRPATRRQVHNFGTPDGLDAVALLVCEVITPAGNWSSHPGHKHDEALPGARRSSRRSTTSRLRAARGSRAPAGADAFGSFATYSSSAGEIETRALVRTGDIALVPYGYHGPAAAAPEYDLYYLNVMAGPGNERAWLFSDDPAPGLDPLRLGRRQRPIRGSHMGRTVAEA